MYCPNCGNKILENELFCSECGEKIKNQTTISQSFFCGNCGLELDNNSEFCGNCGTKQNKDNSSTDISVNITQQPTKTKKKFLFVTVIGILVILIIIGVSVFYYFSITKEDVATTQTHQVQEKVIGNKKDEIRVKNDSSLNDDDSAEEISDSFVDDDSLLSVTSKMPVSDVEEKVVDIKSLYNQTQSSLSSYNKTTSNGITEYLDDNGKLVRVDFPANAVNEYTRYYYLHNGKLYFAFIFNGTQENRLYFYENQLFRWIDEYKTTYDNALENTDFISWESFILNEIAAYLK